ncbi:hypothetical protein [Fusobacterium nucleatum]|uniref:hypothetical protein n=1 Tax=Fusobacterium nucleatum TaxID=851 RepID=UPI0030D290D0
MEIKKEYTITDRNAIFEQIYKEAQENIDKLRYFYNQKANVLTNFLTVKLMENLEKDKENKARKIFNTIVDFVCSDNFLNLKSHPVYKENSGYKVTLKINTTNEELLKLGIDLENNIFDIIKAIENQINS